MRFPSPHLCHFFFFPSRLAKVPSMEGGNMMLAQRRKSQWHPKAGLGSFVSTLRARNSGEGQRHYKLAPKPYVILSLSSPQIFTQHLGAPSCAHYALKSQRRLYHLWPSKQPCSTALLWGNESFQGIHSFYSEAFSS